MSERVVAPSRRRQRRAYAAGVRPRSVWTTTGLAALAVAGLSGGLTEAVRAGVDWSHVGASASPVEALAVAEDHGRGVFVVVGVGLLAAWVVALATTMIDRRMGPARRDPAFAHLMSSVHARRLVVGAGCLVALLVAWRVAAPSLAGAARAVDAPEGALARLWATWWVRVPAFMGLCLLVLGQAERWSAGRRVWEALHVTPAQARRERG